MPVPVPAAGVSSCSSIPLKTSGSAEPHSSPDALHFTVAERRVRIRIQLPVERAVRTLPLDPAEVRRAQANLVVAQADVDGRLARNLGGLLSRSRVLRIECSWEEEG
jgi:hypothetical protein